jgi:uncharacterized protein (TIGR02118 family)
MAKLLVLYRKPADPEAFDTYYATTHIPLAKTIPGLKSFEVSTGAVTAPDGSTPYQLVAALEFESMAALQRGMGSAEGRAAGADVAKFADGGVELIFFETRDA